MTETFHLAVERYRVVKSIEHWYVIDTAELRPRLAEFHRDCPDGEKMAESLASWLNSGPEAGKFLVLDNRTNPKAIGSDGDAYKPEEV